MIRQKLNYLFLALYLPLMAQQGINQYDAEGRRHGHWKTKFEGTEQVKFEGNFEHGQETGEFKFYKRGFDKFPSAIMKFSPTSDSVNVAYYTQEGKAISSGNMVDKQREGKWVYFHQHSSDTMMLEEYEEGKLTGEQRTWYKNGKLAEKTSYKNGKKHGESFVYSDNGQVLQHLNYREGELDGPATYYNAQGDKIIEGQYVNGRKKGNWKYYDEAKLKEEKEF